MWKVEGGKKIGILLALALEPEMGTVYLKRFWGLEPWELIGPILPPQYVEKLDLSDFVSINNDISPRTSAMWSTEGVRVTLKMKHQEVKLQVILGFIYVSVDSPHLNTEVQ